MEPQLSPQLALFVYAAAWVVAVVAGVLAAFNTGVVVLWLISGATSRIKLNLGFFVTPGVLMIAAAYIVLFGPSGP